uniref:Uncharacterized protein n=1 Tax=Rhizophora mucronata TaxID=61149 RepID=A0A2P2QN61_RHIMU
MHRSEIIPHMTIHKLHSIQQEKPKNHA